MRIGNYDLGTPLEFGITGNKQFYYPLGNGAPLAPGPNGAYNPSFQEYFATPHQEYTQFGGNASWRSWLDSTGQWDFQQQFISPGTAYGYGTKTDSENAPYLESNAFSKTL